MIKQEIHSSGHLTFSVLLKVLASIQPSSLQNIILDAEKIATMKQEVQFMK